MTPLLLCLVCAASPDSNHAVPALPPPEAALRIQDAGFVVDPPFLRLVSPGVRQALANHPAGAALPDAAWDGVATLLLGVSAMGPVVGGTILVLEWVLTMTFVGLGAAALGNGAATSPGGLQMLLMGTLVYALSGLALASAGLLLAPVFLSALMGLLLLLAWGLWATRRAIVQSKRVRAS